MHNDRQDCSGSRHSDSGSSLLGADGNISSEELSRNARTTTICNGFHFSKWRAENLITATSEAKQLKRGLVDAIGVQLISDGFALNAAKDFFIRRHNGTTDQFQLVFLDPYDRPGWRIQPYMGLRIERVEDIFHQTSRWDPKYQKDTPTIGSGIGRILSGDNRGCEFFLESSADIPRIATEIVEVFRKYALPYYANFDSIREIDRALNDDPRRDTPHRIVTWLRCATGVIVAKLVDRPDYARLVKIYTKQLRSTDKGFYLSRFEDLVKSLETLDDYGRS